MTNECFLCSESLIGLTDYQKNMHFCACADINFNTPAEWVKTLRSRLISEHAKDLSDSEIERVFSKSVQADSCIKKAKELRDSELLKL